MPKYLKFSSEGEVEVLVEIDEEEVVARPPVGRTGLRETTREVIDQAQTEFGTAIRNAVHLHAQTLLGAVRTLPEAPTDLELTFGLKVTSEGNVAVVKLTGEANYIVKLTWKPVPRAN